ncbi:uncharacterized protein LOC124267486 isoform X2 [Haliotis rubra]|uniref:uncharacterized protein LOC124267486 isoform X2 n=1 Tax=Haliotis rubra TaxID=36100 RepID=UPI001EE5ACD4|nr:uncharacterized protein LOC124267486 isoform X2 [Haliotis rubra]
MDFNEQIHKQKLETPSTSTGVTAGAVVGGILITLLIVGIVLTVLYRNGYRCRNIKDQINGPAQYSNLEEESEKRHYSQLKIYQNTKENAAGDTSTYEGVTETPPVTYESISSPPYQNTGAHSQGPSTDTTNEAPAYTS